MTAGREEIAGQEVTVGREALETPSDRSLTSTSRFLDWPARLVSATGGFWFVSVGVVCDVPPKRLAKFLLASSMEVLMISVTPITPGGSRVVPGGSWVGS